MKIINYLKIASVLLLINCPDAMDAQTDYKGDRVILAVNNSSVESGFYIYEPVYLAKKIFKDTLEAKNLYPEQLMESLISANNQKWVDYNTLGGSEKSKQYGNNYFENVNKADKGTLFLELKAKYTFQYAGTDMAIIKYFYHAPEIPVMSGAYVMQRIGGRWHYTSMSFTSELAVLIMRFDEKKLSLILQGNPTGDLRINEVINAIKDPAGNIHTEKLVKLYASWATTNPDNITYFKDSKAW